MLRVVREGGPDTREADTESTETESHLMTRIKDTSVGRRARDGYDFAGVTAACVSCVSLVLFAYRPSLTWSAGDFCTRSPRLFSSSCLPSLEAIPVPSP